MADDGSSTKFDTGDRLTIVLLCIIFLAVVSSFFFFIYAQGLTSYPTGQVGAAVKAGNFDYFAYALEYRERRLTLSLTLRTFITSLGFVVGLVLAVIGGIFILRRALVDFTASGSTSKAAVPVEDPPVDNQPAKGVDVAPPAPANGKAIGGAVASAVRGASFSIATNSPGIVFLLGGVIVIYVTQLLAIHIGAPEIFPRDVAAVCDRGELSDGSCYVNASSTSSGPGDVTILEAYCREKPTAAGCGDLHQLLSDSGVSPNGGPK